MGDTLEESPPTRRDKPQSLDIAEADEASNGTSSAGTAANTARYTRNRARMRHMEEQREREQSCDAAEAVAGSAVGERRGSLNCEESSPSTLSSSLNKALFGRPTRYPSSCVGTTTGATTRKCVLTLDGYSYVIVASTPENLPGKRDEAGNLSVGSSTANSSNNNGSGAATSTAAATTAYGGSDKRSGNGEQSPTVSYDLGSGFTNATLNGQVAKHGSLTIVRRSNSRKSFTQIDAQQSTLPLASPANAASSSSNSLFQPISEAAAERLTANSSSSSSSSATATTTQKHKQQQQQQTAIAHSQVAANSNKMQPSSPNELNFATDNLIESSSPSLTDFRPSGRTDRSTTILSLKDAQASAHSSESNLESDFLQWETEFLPRVDTPDALSKAASRIRSLLRRMDHENVPYEDMQRNLHYAARVLEAVFIDESRSPTTGKTKLGQISSSSAESEHQPAAAGAQPVNCSQQSQQPTALTPITEQATATDNNSNSSCSLPGDNQTSIESRTKGVSLAPQTHSGPTGPPAAAEQVAQTVSAALETVNESSCQQQQTDNASELTTTTAKPEAAASASGAGASVSSSSSSCSNNATVQRQRRLRTPVWARSMSTNKTTHVRENHGANIFGVSFNTLLGKDEPQVFATAGHNRCTVYECPRKGGITLLHCYADPDPDEVFYTCAWSYDLKTTAPLLAAAGYRGVIRVIDIKQNEAVGNYIGHGQAINELKFHPHKLQLLLSGSKDHAIRLWNIQTHVCIAIFGGVEGHRDEVLSIDFNMRGDRIVSSGMDHSLKLWCLNTPEFQHKIELSHSFSQEKSTLPFPTITKHFPDFSTRDIHRNYVDCVQWFGNFVLSKSCENAIVCWKPGQLHQTFEQLKPSDSSCTIIAEFEYDECEIWFVRFGFNPWQKVIALGNQQGKVYVWELDPSDPEGAHMTTLHNMRSVSTVRQIAFSRDASVLVYVCDDATVWRWNRRQAGNN